jgi:hypothetical protein
MLWVVPKNSRPVEVGHHLPERNGSNSAQKIRAAWQTPPIIPCKSGNFLAKVQKIQGK